MKTIFKLLILIIIIIPINIQASTYKFKEGEYIPNAFVIKESSTSSRYQQIKTIKNSKTNEIVYCIEPFNQFIGDYYYSGTHSSKTGSILEEDFQKIKLIAYFGYGYEDHTESYWYAITQVLIWRVIEPSSSFAFTKTLNGVVDNNIYQEEINEINNLIDQYNKGNITKNITIYENQPYNVELLNNNITSNLNYTIKDNQVYIDTNISGYITFTEDYNDYNQEASIYYHSSDQKLMSRGDLQSITNTTNINVEKGTLELINFDESDNLLTTNIYGLYDSNHNLISTGNNQVFDLPNYGTYYIKELVTTEGYIKDEQIYNFEVTSSNLNNKIITKSNIITSTLNITKYYEDYHTKKLYLEDNAEFGIYSESNELIKTVNTKNGIIKETLTYGNYIIKQHTSIENYYKTEDINISVKNNNETLNYELINKEIISILNIHKKDTDTKELISIPIKFTIYDNINKEYICIDECYFTTNEEGIISVPLSIGNYQISEINENLGDYLWNDQSIEINITINSNREISIDFYNQKKEIETNEIPTNQIIEETKTPENFTKIEVPDTNLNQNYAILYISLILFVVNKKFRLVK